MKKILILIMFLTLSLSFWSSAGSQTAFSGQEVKKGHPKIESSLIQLLEKQKMGDKAAAQEFARSLGAKIDKKEMIIVFLLPEPGKTREAINIDQLRALGGEVIKSGDYIIKARVPVSMLEQIAEKVEGISFIKLPDQPLAEVVSEAVSLTGASLFHSSGYSGQNVKVAVIDAGFANLSAAISNGEVPDSVIKIDCTGTKCTSTDFSSETVEHGTACAEVVYDMAPGAQLYVIKALDRLDLKDAKDYCISNKIRIVSVSLGWVDTSFGDGACYNDNPVCSANDAYSKGILWVNSAGNYARQHYSATYKDSGVYGVHEEPIKIYAQAGETINAYLIWNAWPATDQDYDLYLFNSETISDSSIVAGSENPQTGTQPPKEFISYVVPSTGTYYLGVARYKATYNVNFKVFVTTHYITPYVASGSIASPADATNVLAVAAIDQAKWTSGPQEEFSSQGPTPDGRTKPDISGPANVSNFTYGSFPGTSAATPHVAGAAALILSAFPAYTVSELWNALTSSAVDMGPSGKDNVYGYGRLSLPETPPPDGPDLAGEWAYLYETCRLTSGGLKCKITGSLEVRNIGTLKATPTYADFYLSDLIDIVFLKRVKTGSLKPNTSKLLKLSYNMPLGYSAIDLYVIAVLDADDTIIELDEDNNFLSYGPIE